MTIWSIIGDSFCLMIFLCIGWNILGIPATVKAWFWLYDHGNHIGIPTLVLVGKLALLIGIIVWLEYDHILMNSLQIID